MASLKSAVPEVNISDNEEKINRLIANIEQVFFGKRDVIRLCVTGLLARGHLLIEDVPGIGKTTLAQALARSLDTTFNRIQFTSDMLPADILGVSILNARTSEFEFRKGPIFAGIVLADEVNRTPPKTQSALLEAMSEFHISIDGHTHPLPRPFMVLATQNPIEYDGTYTLPEAQLDRFLLRVGIGYPATQDEIRIIRRSDPVAELESLSPVLSSHEVIELQNHARQIHVDDSIAHYILAIVQRTRNHDDIQLGVSPRGALSFYEAAQAHAMVEARHFVTPDDVKRMAIPVLAHRLIIKSRSGDLIASSQERARLINEILNDIPTPV